jgi:type VI secretion system protein ImpE
MMTTQTETAGSLFKQGKLTAALAAANDAVKAKPTDLPARVLLAEMLLFAGNLERADVLLDAAGQMDPSASLVVAEFRQLLRADMARRQLYRDGRLPEFLGEPSDAETALLAAYVAQRAGDYAEASARADEAEALRPKRHGKAGDVAFEDFRDASDLHSAIMEVLTTTGKYYWVPVSRIESMIFHKPVRPRDLAWRRVSMSVASGPDGDVYVPAVYFAETADIADELRLGRATDWTDPASGPVRGMGQRMFLVGDEALGIMDLDSVSFEE